MLYNLICTRFLCPDNCTATGNSWLRRALHLKWHRYVLRFQIGFCLKLCLHACNCVVNSREKYTKMVFELHKVNYNECSPESSIVDTKTHIFDRPIRFNVLFRLLVRATVPAHDDPGAIPAEHVEPCKETKLWARNATKNAFADRTRTCAVENNRIDHDFVGVQLLRELGLLRGGVPNADCRIVSTCGWKDLIRRAGKYCGLSMNNYMYRGATGGFRHKPCTRC